MNRRLIFTAVVLIFIMAYLLRVAFLHKLALIFGYDQARDAYVAQQIIKGDLKILGPPASTPGLYHGVFYYYLLAPAYWLGKGNPIIAAYWVALFNAATVFTVFCLTYLFTKRVGAAILASFLFAISFEATQYATWLSNPTIAVWTVPLLYLGLWSFLVERKSWGAIVAGVGLGLSIQADIFLLYHGIPVAFWMWRTRQKIRGKDILYFLTSFLICISTMILSEVKFGFKGISGVISLLTTQDAIVASKGLGDFLVLFLNQISRPFGLSSYPANIGYGSVLVLALITLALLEWTKKKSLAKRKIAWQPFLATWLFSHITVVTLGGTSTPFLLVGIGPAVSIILAIFLWKWFLEKKRVLAVLLLVILLLGNLAAIFRNNPRGSVIFAIQKDMLLKKQLALIDYTYQEAKGAPFSISSLTSPLWINIVWTYLYKWYGQDHYGYLPSWHGRSQVGQLDALPEHDSKTKIYFLILEPIAGIPKRYLKQTIDEENSVSRLIEEKYFGELRVQKREAVEKKEI